MILKKSHRTQPLPEHVETHTTQLLLYPKGDPKLVPGSTAYLVNHVSPAETYLLERDEKTKDLFGTPLVYSVGHSPDASFLRLHPTPDRDYFAVFRYNPAAREI